MTINDSKSIISAINRAIEIQNKADKKQKNKK